MLTCLRKGVFSLPKKQDLVMQLINRIWFLFKYNAKILSAMLQLSSHVIQGPRMYKQNVYDLIFYDLV